MEVKERIKINQFKYRNFQKIQNIKYKINKKTKPLHTLL